MVSLEQNIKRYTFADHIFISFPKSGRTWIRFFIAKYIELAFKKEFTLELEGIKDIPNIVFTHNYFDIYQNEKGTPKLILTELLKTKSLFILVRDPRDVAVSYFHQKCLREEKISQMDINDFVLSDIYGIERQSEFVLQLLDLQKTVHTSILIKYESLKKDPESYLYKIINRIFGSVKETEFKTAIQESTFEKMKEYEIKLSKEEVGDFSRLGKKDWDGNTNALKVRKGKINSYLDELLPETIEKFEKLEFTNRLINALKELD